MITFLKVRNLAIVEELAIDPGPGLNVLTGETGAGKSLLIDSLEFLSGERGSSEMVRSGSERMQAEAIFSVPSTVRPLLEEAGIEFELDGEKVEVIIRREMTAAGRGRVLLNGSAVTVRELLPLAESLLEIHGQDESRGRVAGQSYLEMLDSYAGNAELVSNLRTAYRAWQEKRALLEELEAAHRDRALRVDLLKYQIDEIGPAALKVEEEDLLRSERAVLGNAQEIVAASAAAYQLLEEDELSVTEQLSHAVQHLSPLARSVEEIRQLHDELDELRTRLREVGRNLSRIADTVRHDPERLDELEERLALIERLKKKYGGSIEAVLAHLETVTREFDQLSNYDSHSQKLQGEERQLFERYRTLALALSAQRKAAAAALQSDVEEELKDLAMERTRVRIEVAFQSEASSLLQIDGGGVSFGPDGFDRIDVLVAPNLGDEPKPMQRIASGGELSRMQLAIATALFRHSDRVSTATLVFDEIDSGVGGRVAEAVGRKLARLAERNQVLCVTHLPQIAALGTTHFRVWKEEADGRTRACIERLESQEQRVVEIARMLGGERVTDSARTHAAELLALSSAEPERKRRPSARATTAR